MTPSSLKSQTSHGIQLHFDGRLCVVPSNSMWSHRKGLASFIPVIRARWWFVIPFLLSSIQLGGQEALRTAIEADRSYRARLPSPDRPPNELLAGPVQFGVGASFFAEWTDNVNISDADPQSDISLRPQVDLSALWPITDRARLNLGVGLGYTFYLEGNRDDRFFLSPASQIAFDFSVKDLLFTIYDSVRYSDDPTSQGDLQTDQDYAQIDNTAGLRATWFLDDWQLQAGYAHYNSWSLTDDLSDTDRSSEQLFARVAYSLAAQTRAGVEFSGSFTDYSVSTRDDYQSFSAGPFIEWSVTEDLEVTARGGYVLYVYDDSATGPSLGTLDSYYVGIRADHRLTTSVSHNFSASREVQVGINSDYQEVFRVQYGARWNLIDPATLSASVSYEHSTQPQFDLEEVYDRIGFSVGLGYEFIRRLHGNLSYRFTWRDSETSGQDYTQNTVTVGVSYRL
jgi:predicted porin